MPPAGHPAEPNGPPPQRSRRELPGGVVAGMVVVGVAVVGFALSGVTGGMEPIRELGTTPADTVNPPDVAPENPPVGEVPENPPVEARPESVPRPSTAVRIDAPAEPASEPVVAGALPLGTKALIGDDYVVAMTAVDLDATELIVAELPTNEPPPAGETYVMVTVDAQFIGDGEGEPYFDLVVGAVDDQQREFYDVDCLPVAPGDMYDRPPLATGGAIVGTFCLTVPIEATASLTFFVAEHGSITATQVWWSANGRAAPEPPSGATWSTTWWVPHSVSSLPRSASASPPGRS
jgi:hypothetical protein